MLLTVTPHFRCTVSRIKMGAIVSSFCNHLSRRPQSNINSNLDDQRETMPDTKHVANIQQAEVNSMARSHLLEVVENGKFWTLPDDELLQVIKKEFTEELDHLKTAYSVRPSGWQEMPGSPSRILFPNEPVYDEVNRSLVGILALRWINNEDYHKFTGNQPERVKLRKESFNWIRGIFESQGIINSNSYKLYALITSMVSNDLGKSTSFIEAYLKVTGEDIGRDNHDMILQKAVEKCMVPALERLEPTIRNEIKEGIKLGGEFNVGQLAQAEDAPASMVPLLGMVNKEGAWNMRWMEQILDLAGAAGHEDHSCARKLIEPIFRSYRSVYDIVIGIVQRKLTLRQGYDQNLTTRYDLIVESGWKPPMTLAVDHPEDRALMRIFCMANVADTESADLYYNAFYSTEVVKEIRQQLVQYLNRDGTVHEPAIQPTYGPAMFSLALSNFCKSPRSKAPDCHEARHQVVAAMLRYLARVFAKPPSGQMMSEGNVTVIERDCRVAVKSTLNSEEFPYNPNVLDDAPLPEDTVANRTTDAENS